MRFPKLPASTKPETTTCECHHCKDHVRGEVSCTRPATTLLAFAIQGRDDYADVFAVCEPCRKRARGPLHPNEAARRLRGEMTSAQFAAWKEANDAVRARLDELTPALLRQEFAARGIELTDAEVGASDRRAA